MGPTPVHGAVAPCGFTSSVTICAVACDAAKANTIAARKLEKIRVGMRAKITSGFRKKPVV